MTDTKGKVVLSRNAMEEILRLATLNVYGVTGLAPVTFAERFTGALALPSTPKGVDARIRKDGTIEVTVMCGSSMVFAFPKSPAPLHHRFVMSSAA